MPLPLPVAERRRVHKRAITLEGFRRSDGLWDIEGHLQDTKDAPFDIHGDMRLPGDAVHDISVRLTIDHRMNVLDVAVSFDVTAFPGTCETVGPDYRQVVGLNLFKGFVKTVKTLFRDTQGCTHVSELLMSMPTAAFQAFAGQVRYEDRVDARQVPYHLDRCHALSLESEVVRRAYPRWYRGGKPVSGDALPGMPTSPEGRRDAG